MKKLFLPVLLVSLVSGCTSMEFDKRDMKLTTPIFSYEAHTEGLRASKIPKAVVNPSPFPTVSP